MRRIGHRLRAPWLPILAWFVAAAVIVGSVLGLLTLVGVAPWSPRGDVRLTLVADGFGPLSSVRSVDGQLVVVERAGRLVRVADQAVLLDISDHVSSTEGELGMLDVVERDGRLFVTYTDLERDLRLSEFTDGERPILEVPQESAWHKAGGLAFGPDGMLYVGVGDDTTGGEARIWEPNSLLRSILRIDVDGDPYAIPEDNPFGNEVWLYGFRNPWRFSFDGSDLYIGDVGADGWEELNVHRGEPGANFGWSAMEGPECRLEDCPPDLVPPLHAFPHSGGDCAIIGGFVSDVVLPGEYIFADLCGRIRSMRPGAEPVVQVEADTLLSAVGTDDEGRLYIVTVNAGEVYRVDPG
jgi:glucose/arabinose dehydrogenase